MVRKTSPDMINSTSVTIRFPEKIYTWLKARSDKERRSFNAQVVLEIERLMEQEKNTTQPPTFD